MKRQMLPIVDAAKALQTTPLNVLMHIKRGHLQGSEHEGIWLIDKASLEELLTRTGGGKAADLCASGCAKKHACGGGCG